MQTLEQHSISSLQRDLSQSMTGRFPLQFLKQGNIHSGNQPNRAYTIGIDARCLAVASTRRRGIGRYVTNLVRKMSELAPQNRLILLGDEVPWDRADLNEFIARPNVTYKSYCPHYHEELDVFLLTDPLPVLTDWDLIRYPHVNTPCASIIYDMIPLAYPQHYLAPSPKLHREFLGRLRQLAEQVSLFLPISNFVAGELQERLGTPLEMIRPILGGLDDAFQSAPSHEETQRSLQEFGITTNYFLYAGGYDFRKNLPTLLKAFSTCIRQNGEDCKLVLVGDANGTIIDQMLTQLNLESLRERILLPGFISDEQLRCLYAGAVALVFPSLHEGFGLPAIEAMASGCPVIASNSSSLKEIVADAGIQINPESADEIADAMNSLRRHPALSEEYRKRGHERALLYRWTDVASKTLSALSEIATGRKMSAPSRRLRVMVQNRADAFTARGGDTEVMAQLYKSLRNRDIEVDVGCGNLDLSDHDLVHLINITLPQVADEAASNAERCGIPLVITTLFEDWARYLDKSSASVGLFREYIAKGYDRSYFENQLKALRFIKGSEQQVNTTIIDRADAMIACGSTEAANLLNRFPSAVEKIHSAHFAVNNLGDLGEVDAEGIKAALGVEEYLLCCGRLETRKNQLMLLKALEDDDIAIILAGGGFSAQPEYVQLVKNFKRKGPVRILGRVDKGTLITLMSAASAHVLPSWYELPGLVTLEAASCGTPIVATNWGAIHDYMPRDLMYPCSPENPDSVRAAVMDARSSTPNPELRRIAQSFSLERFGQEVQRIYEKVLKSRQLDHQRIRSLKPETSNNLNKSRPSEVTMSISDQQKAFDVSIIIPACNQSRMTRECLEAICADSPRATYEVIVVDNHSTDDTPRILQAIEGDIKVLREPVNRGFAAACNRGAHLADGRYLLFLNNDTVTKEGWLDALHECAARNPDAGAIGARMIYPAGDTQHAGIAFNDESIPYHVFQHFPADHAAVNELRDMQAVSAACMMVPAKLYDELGGMDEGYRNGFEDIDLCLRMREKNYRVVYCPSALVVHHEESSEGRKDHDQSNLNRFLLAWKDRVQSDEAEITARFGYHIEWGEQGGTYREIAQKTTAQERESVDDTNVQQLLDEATKLYVTGDYQEAADNLQKIIETKMAIGNEDGFEAWQTLGNCLARLNRAEEAENAYLEAVRLNKDSERPFLGLGSVAMLQQNWTAAQYGFMAALARNPETTRAEFGIGVSLAARERHEDALEYFRTVIEKEPDNAEALFYLYKSAMESSHPRDAVKPLEAYAASHPTDTDFLFNLCGALWKAGQISRAVEVCRQLLEVDPNHEQARDALEHMSKTLAEDA